MNVGQVWKHIWAGLKETWSQTATPIFDGIPEVELRVSKGGRIARHQISFL